MIIEIHQECMDAIFVTEIIGKNKNLTRILCFSLLFEREEFVVRSCDEDECMAILSSKMSKFFSYTATCASDQDRSAFHSQKSEIKTQYTQVYEILQDVLQSFVVCLHSVYI